MNRIAAVAAASVLVAGLGACGGTAERSSSPSRGREAAQAAPAPAANEVDIKTFIFRPSPLTVEAGTTVTWTNRDDILHTVTEGRRGGPAGRFDEKLEGIGSAARVTFDRPGTYHYYCKIHPGMEADVVVK